ncbi:DSBA-like thioredoxin domain protein [Rhizoctonia solani]|uniref:DSBA-like thioredoxin domain protein n=1 Tax=Rhizoctonia solani TaxID=456999 RepID=A0A8H8NTN4_9AGAM|nr:DSBA-like thioredoxin domain protein [Rhizoctonia solani]QRW18420.1 DSBA-like thioredoxin domain protein [Rhizoctonia solani]
MSSYTKGQVITLTITSAIVCPWCYIATLELRRAIARAYKSQLPLRFQIEYRPFECKTILYDTADRAKIESQGRAQKLGITLRRQSNTQWKSASASRLLLHAYQKGGQNAQQALLTELFRAHHEKNEDIDDFEILADYCERIGIMSREETFMFLESNCLLDEVEQTLDIARSMGISVVPLTVINNKWSLVGAQSSDVYYKIFLQLAQGKDL